MPEGFFVTESCMIRNLGNTDFGPLLHHPGPWNAGGKSGAKMLPCVSLANSCQLARRGILRVKETFHFLITSFISNNSDTFSL